MIVSVGNQELAVPARQSQRMLEPHLVAEPVFVAKIKQVAARYCAHFRAGAQTNRANDVCFGIGNKQGFSITGQGGRLGKSGSRRSSVRQSGGWADKGPIHATFTAGAGEG